MNQNKNKDIQTNKDKIIQKHNVYYKKVRNKEKMIITERFSIKLIQQVNKDLRHIGVGQILKSISSLYVTNNSTKNIKEVCRNCEVCIKNKTRGQHKYGLMSHLGPARKPFEIVSIDTIGGFGGSRSTKKYLHLLIDHFTRYAFIITSKTQSAHDFIKLVNKVTEPDEIGILLTDQYPGINSTEFKKFLNDKQITIIFTAVNAPFSNRLNERLNQTLVNKIRCKSYEDEQKRAWTTIAHDCVEIYNQTIHSVTGFSPAYLLYGTDVTILPKELRQERGKSVWMRDKKTAFNNTLKSHDYNKMRYDKNRKDREFNEGDMVYDENGNKLNRKKLDELRIGPYKIINERTNTIYEIDTGHRKTESNLFHVSKFIPVQMKEEEETSNEDIREDIEETKKKSTSEFSSPWGEM
ncbi:hypothetical protein WA026_001812 [Henosepilachna vigintioctopunctata]|uniref:RNA-directed DNA polymerase n=1 Tax=Henosepilachna vigintioctopunctata TaxID=420089 RepID=A0AAW1UUJ6_9CUCU